MEHSLEHYAPNEEWFLLNISVVERKYEHEGILVGDLHRVTYLILTLHLIYISYIAPNLFNSYIALN